MQIKYLGPVLDFSGYGEANRHDIGALKSAGIDVTIESTRHCLELSEFGELGQMMRDCVNLPGPYDIKILHTTPNLYPRYIEPGKYHIGRVFWETDKLPPDFAHGCSLMNEIWTGSEFNAQAIRNSGVTVPIYIIPEAISTPAPKVKPYIIPNQSDYKFYSIFEWTERKNPTALLESYWREFEGVDNVSLTLKVYIDNFTPEKRASIKEMFAQVKRKLNLTNYAPVYIYTKLMDRKGIYRFHTSFDCYVSAHRGEGWGIPQMEAMLMGRPMISTDCGGIHEYVKDVAMLVPCTMVPVANVDRNGVWYRPDQNWAQIDTDELRKAMRYAYQFPKECQALGEAGAKRVKEKFALKVVGQIMRDRLLEITSHLTTT